jgi:hypothetical protein
MPHSEWSGFGGFRFKANRIKSTDVPIAPQPKAIVSRIPRSPRSLDRKKNGSFHDINVVQAPSFLSSPENGMCMLLGRNQRNDVPSKIVRHPCRDSLSHPN